MAITPTQIILVGASDRLASLVTRVLTSRFADALVEEGDVVVVLAGDEAVVTRDRELPRVVVPLSVLVPVATAVGGEDAAADIAAEMAAAIQQAETILFACLDALEAHDDTTPPWKAASRTGDVRRRYLRPDGRVFCASASTEVSFRVDRGRPRR